MNSGLQARLETVGYAGSAHVSFDEAVLNVVAERRPDILLVEMPSSDQSNGIEIALCIHKSCAVPVICLLPPAQESLMRWEKDLPLVSYLLQPCTDQELRAAIEISLYQHAQEIHLQEMGKTLREREEQLALARADVAACKQTDSQLRHYADEQAALVAVISAASAFLEPDVLLAKILEVVMAIPEIQADAGWALVIEDDREEWIRLGPVRGVSETLLHVENTIPLNDCPICAAWLDRIGFTGQELSESCFHLDPQSLVNAGIQDHIAIPLSVGQRMLGVINLGWQKRRDSLLMERPLLLSIGRQVGLALRNAQLYQSAIKVNRLEAISKISAAAASTLELDIVLQQVLEKACQALDAVAGAILLTIPDSKELAFAYISPDSLNVQSHQHVSTERGIIGWVVQYRQVARINDIKRDPSMYRGLKPIFGPGIDSLICAPLVHRDQFTGVIAIFNKRYGEFSQEDADLLEAISSISASALDNARLYKDLKQSLLEKERTQAQLIQSEKIAALGRLAASVAHEINNPLQAVQGCLSLLVEELSGPQRQDKVDSYLHIIDKEIERVVGIVHGMRDFARPAPVGTRSTDVISVLKDVLTLAEKQLQHSKVNTECSWGVNVPSIQANPNLLKQVFLNMILNASDAMAGGGTLQIVVAADQISMQDDALPQPAIRIDFCDAGPGMSPEAMSRLFEPFYTTKDQGSGLGLYISYTIIQSLKGKIEVTSSIGLGTTFTILLPLKHTEE